MVFHPKTTAYLLLTGLVLILLAVAAVNLFGQSAPPAPGDRTAEHRQEVEQRKAQRREQWARDNSKRYNRDRKETQGNHDKAATTQDNGSGSGGRTGGGGK